MEFYKHKSGKQLFHLNKHETDFIYREIYDDRVYLKNGIRLSCDSVVVDVGANIGLFGMFLNDFFEGCRVYLVEPSPVLCEIIRANVRTFSHRATVVNAGVSNKECEAVFTFYPGYSIISGFKTDSMKDGAFIRGGIRNQLAKLRLPPDAEDRFVESLMQGKLDNPERYHARLKTLSQLFAEEAITTVDLLKIDAEGCEYEVLEGLAPEDWEKIRQIVMEVHDRDGQLLQSICDLLRSQDFELIVEQEENFKTTGIQNLYAFGRGHRGHATGREKGTGHRSIVNPAAAELSVSGGLACHRGPI